MPSSSSISFTPLIHRHEGVALWQDVRSGDESQYADLSDSPRVCKEMLSRRNSWSSKTARGREKGVWEDLFPCGGCVSGWRIAGGSTDLHGGNVGFLFVLFFVMKTEGVLPPVGRLWLLLEFFFVPDWFVWRKYQIAAWNPSIDGLTIHSDRWDREASDLEASDRHRDGAWCR